MAFNQQYCKAERDCVTLAFVVTSASRFAKLMAIFAPPAIASQAQLRR